MFTILIVVMNSQVYTDVKTYLTVYFKLGTVYCMLIILQ